MKNRNKSFFINTCVIKKKLNIKLICIKNVVKPVILIVVQVRIDAVLRQTGQFSVSVVVQVPFGAGRC